MCAINENIKKRRIQLDMSQEELARLTGYNHRSAINKIELGINHPSWTKIEDFARALLTTPESLMIDTDDLSDNMLALYGELNEAGKKKVRDYADDLTRLDQYTVQDGLR